MHHCGCDMRFWCKCTFFFCTIFARQIPPAFPVHFSTPPFMYSILVSTGRLLFDALEIALALRGTVYSRKPFVRAHSRSYTPTVHLSVPMLPPFFLCIFLLPSTGNNASLLVFQTSLTHSLSVEGAVFFLFRD